MITHFTKEDREAIRKELRGISRAIDNLAEMFNFAVCANCGVEAPQKEIVSSPYHFFGLQNPDYPWKHVADYDAMLCRNCRAEISAWDIARYKEEAVDEFG